MGNSYPNFQNRKDVEKVISSSLTHISSKGIKISDTDAMRYLNCTVYLVANGIVDSDCKPQLFGETVCLVSKEVLFSLGIEKFLEISKLKLYSDSAEVDFLVHPTEDRFHLKLSKKQRHWMVN